MNDQSTLRLISPRPRNRPATCHSEATGGLDTSAGRLTLRTRRYDVRTPMRGGRRSAIVTVFHVAIQAPGAPFVEVWTSGPDFPADSHLGAYLLAADRVEAWLAARASWAAAA